MITVGAILQLLKGGAGCLEDFQSPWLFNQCRQLDIFSNV